MYTPSSTLRGVAGVASAAAPCSAAVRPPSRSRKRRKKSMGKFAGGSSNGSFSASFACRRERPAARKRTDGSLPPKPQPGHHEGETGEAAAGFPEGCDFFEQDEQRESGDPPEVHDAAGKQQEHQRPAAAEAVQPVQPAEIKAPGRARPPMLGQKLGR